MVLITWIFSWPFFGPGVPYHGSDDSFWYWILIVKSHPYSQKLTNKFWVLWIPAPTSYSQNILIQFYNYFRWMSLKYQKQTLRLKLNHTRRNIKPLKTMIVYKSFPQLLFITLLTHLLLPKSSRQALLRRHLGLSMWAHFRWGISHPYPHTFKMIVRLR